MVKNVVNLIIDKKANYAIKNVKVGSDANNYLFFIFAFNIL